MCPGHCNTPYPPMEVNFVSKGGRLEIPSLLQSVKFENFTDIILSLHEQVMYHHNKYCQKVS